MIIIDPDNDKYLDTMLHIKDSYIVRDHVITLMAALCRYFPIINTFRHSKEKWLYAARDGGNLYNLILADKLLTFKLFCYFYTWAMYMM